MLPATAKSKGRTTENQLCEWIRSQGYDAERRRLNGSLDKGDITVRELPRLVIEVKSGAGIWKPTEWVRQTLAEMRNADAISGLLAIRPARSKGIGDWLGITFESWYAPHVVNVPPTMPWPQIYALAKANPNTRFSRYNGTGQELLIAMLPKAWDVAVAAAQTSP
jgi:hypothetical protein